VIEKSTKRVREREVIKYLMGFLTWAKVAREHAPELLFGNVDEFLAMVATTVAAKVYESDILSWSESLESVSKEKVRRVCLDYIRLKRGCLRSPEICSIVVLHQRNSGFDCHIVMLRTHLPADLSVSYSFHNKTDWHVKRVWRRIVNLQEGWSDPDDLGRHRVEQQPPQKMSLDDREPWSECDKKISEDVRRGIITNATELRAWLEESGYAYSEIEGGLEIVYEEKRMQFRGRKYRSDFKAVSIDTYPRENLRRDREAVSRELARLVPKLDHLRRCREAMYEGRYAGRGVESRSERAVGSAGRNSPGIPGVQAGGRRQSLAVSSGPEELEQTSVPMGKNHDAVPESSDPSRSAAAAAGSDHDRRDEIRDADVDRDSNAESGIARDGTVGADSGPGEPRCVAGERSEEPRPYVASGDFCETGFGLAGDGATGKAKGIGSLDSPNGGDRTAQGDQRATLDGGHEHGALEAASDGWDYSGESEGGAEDSSRIPPDSAAECRNVDGSGSDTVSDSQNETRKPKSRLRRNMARIRRLCLEARRELARGAESLRSVSRRYSDTRESERIELRELARECGQLGKRAESIGETNRGEMRWSLDPGGESAARRTEQDAQGSVRDARVVGSNCHKLEHAVEDFEAEVARLAVRKKLSRPATQVFFGRQDAIVSQMTETAFESPSRPSNLERQSAVHGQFEGIEEDEMER